MRPLHNLNPNANSSGCLGICRGLWVVLLLCFFLTSCGYRFGRGGIRDCYSTISVPYVEGDDTGLMTNALVRTLSTKGGLSYLSSGAQLLLKVCLFEPIDENIGFIYAPEKDGGISNIVVSNEARLRLIAEVSLIDCCSGECVLGPLEISSSIDYDFESDLSNVQAHAFSLGQLEMNNLAKDAAFPSLYTLLAEKIVDYVRYSL